MVKEGKLTQQRLKNGQRIDSMVIMKHQRRQESKLMRLLRPFLKSALSNLMRTRSDLIFKIRQVMLDIETCLT